MKNRFMNSSFKQNIGKAVAVILFVFVLPASSLHAHDFKVDGKTVKGKLVDYNTTHVLIEGKGGKRTTAAINELSEDDIEYITSLVTIRDAKNRETFQQRTLEQKRVELMSRTSDVWYVAMTARNGNSFTRTVFANNSQQASYFAQNQFPYSRVEGVRKQRSFNSRF